MKRLVLSLFLVCLFTGTSLGSNIQDGLDELTYAELQISAITTDMRLYLGWFPEEKELMGKASQKALKDLDEVKRFLTSLDIPDELTAVKKKELKLIASLEAIYTGVEKKEMERIKQEFVLFREFYSQYLEEVKKFPNEYRFPEKLPNGFVDPLSKEFNLIENQEDKEVYLNAVKLMKSGTFSEAYSDFNYLKDKYESTFFADCVKLRICECLLAGDSSMQGKVEELSKKAFSILSDTLDSPAYSPVLYEAFYRWRTRTQTHWHGMSNMSNIPNKKYNKKRRQAIQTIKQYLKINPDDKWAKTQISLLLTLPNIGRGGAFGNDNLKYEYMLSGGIKEKKPEEGKKKM